jgi:hypothetical protein
MAEKANITSLDAIKSFREALIIYLSKARPTVEEVSADIKRTRNWIESEQRMLWEGQRKRIAKEVEEAQAALFSSKMSNLREPSVAEQMAVVHAKRALVHAEGKLKQIKYWDREFPNQAEPLEKQVDKLHSVFATDMAQAVAYLTQVIITLEEYAAIAPPSGAMAEPGANAEPTSENAEASAGATGVPASEPESKSASEGKDL